ncbi:MAG: trypsin-like peptidase domain-containing protein [Verrucomicrobia bacterium]|nr:trypsin-like peptidase domain-containing protein [Verrucomicrobiota bacterium]
MKRLQYLLVASLGAAVAHAQQPAPASEDIPDDIVRKVDPSVVAIQHETAAGSGFIITPDGYLLSNGHVVRGSDEEDPTQPAKSITVILNDEQKFPAKVVGFSLDPDVALLKIDPGHSLRPVEFADSRHVQIGQRCFAVGMPLGLKRTFTGGILSNVDRTDLGTETKVFQTDAAINPGNSGGPLFDHNGRVLGINTYARSGANNLGFTIPIHVALTLKDHFLAHGRFVRSDLPCYTTCELYAELARALQAERGVLVSAVLPRSAADKAGLRAGDIIVATDGQSTSARTRAELLDYNWGVNTRKPGSQISFTVLRGSPGARQTHTIQAQLQTMELLPRYGFHAGEIVEHRYDVLGLGVRQVVTASRILHRLPEADGVLVSTARQGDPAGKAGLKGNDILTHVAGKPTPDVAAFQRELEVHLARGAKAIELTVVRGRSTRVTALAPFYGLRNIRIALVIPARDAEHVDLLRRELLAGGATLAVVAPNTPTDGSRHDVILLAGGPGARDLWTDAETLRLVKEAHAAGKVVAAVGPSAVVLANAIVGIEGKKLTTTKADSAEIIRRKANYTGKPVETDGKVVTTTGFDRATVRDFLKTLDRIARANR